MIETERRTDPYAGSAGNIPNVNGTDSQQATQINFVSYMPRPAYRFKPTLSVAAPETEGGYGRRLRRNLAQVRRHIDCVASTLNYIENRCWQKSGCSNERLFMQPHILYSTDCYPPVYTPDKPIDCVTTKFVRSAMNKVKCPIYDICWTPEGRRLITGASSGEFTLWNGTAFNFETILQAHDSAVRAMKWSHNDSWLATADHDGFVKYWQTNMNNVTMFQAHKEAVRGISFCPNDAKFTTASDDGTVRIWDFLRCHEERILRGHGSDVRSVDWHPSKALLVSGSRDSQQPVKLWDPKTGHCLATMHDHKNAVMAVQWNANGNWFLSASKDHLIKMYDIRMMKELLSFKGHKKEVTAVSWHPVHESLFVSGSSDGAIMFWLVGNEREVGLMETAHDQAVWTLKWHPLGHILASGSNDNNTKFWTRNKPGDLLEDFYGMCGSSSFDQSSTSIASGPPSQRHQPQSLANYPQSDHQQQHRPLLEISPVKRDQYHTSNAGASNWPPHNNQSPIKQPLMPQAIDNQIPNDVMSSNQATASIPGLGGMDSSGLFRSRRDPRDSFPVTQPPGGGRKPLLKQPPPKRAQRQFERVWNVGNQFVPDYEEAPVMSDPDYRRNLQAMENRDSSDGGMIRRPPSPLPPPQPLMPPQPFMPPPTSQYLPPYPPAPPQPPQIFGGSSGAGRALLPAPDDSVPDLWELGGPGPDEPDDEFSADQSDDVMGDGGAGLPPPSGLPKPTPLFANMDLRHAPSSSVPPRSGSWSDGSGAGSLPSLMAHPAAPPFPMPPMFGSGAGGPGAPPMPPVPPRDPRAMRNDHPPPPPPPPAPPGGPYRPPAPPSFPNPPPPPSRDPRNSGRVDSFGVPTSRPSEYGGESSGVVLTPKSEFDPMGGGSGAGVAASDPAGRSPLVNPKRKWAEDYEAEETARRPGTGPVAGQSSESDWWADTMPGERPQSGGVASSWDYGGGGDAERGGRRHPQEHRLTNYRPRRPQQHSSRRYI